MADLAPHVTRRRRHRLPRRVRLDRWLQRLRLCPAPRLGHRRGDVRLREPGDRRAARLVVAQGAGHRADFRGDGDDPRSGVVDSAVAQNRSDGEASHAERNEGGSGVQHRHPERSEGRRFMIARIWRGETRADRADAYTAYLEKTGATECRETPGNRGVRVLRRLASDRAQFVFISFWDNWDSIRAFAGSDVEAAHYYPEDKDFLLYLEPQVQHYEVVEGA